MLYYQSECGKLIRHNNETNIIQHVNVVGKRQYLDKNQLNELKTIRLKKNIYFELLNIFYSDVYETWQFEGTSYRNFKQFQIENGAVSNYKIGEQIPWHNFISDKGYEASAIIVYHQGRVCYHTVMYQGEFTGKLFDIKTKTFMRWANLKHCSPVNNISTGKYL